VADERVCGNGDPRCAMCRRHAVGEGLVYGAGRGYGTKQPLCPKHLRRSQKYELAQRRPAV
jgi:hypothetical protein